MTGSKTQSKKTMYSKTINRTNHLPIRVIVLSFYFVIAATLEVKATRTFNIQIVTPSLSTDSLHSRSTKTVGLPEIVFAYESEEIEPARCKAYDMHDELIFDGTQEEWSKAQDQQLKEIKIKADFLFFTGNTKIYKVFTPVSFGQTKTRRKSQDAIRSKKIRKSKNRQLYQKAARE